jgi:hypothetical protein
MDLPSKTLGSSPTECARITCTDYAAARARISGGYGWVGEWRVWPASRMARAAWMSAAWVSVCG